MTARTLSPGDTQNAERLARLLEYPGLGDELTLDAAGLARGLEVRPGAGSLASAAHELAAFWAARSPSEREEIYVRTFDLQAPICLDVGYQIFGESYKRGIFLVTMRQALRRHGLDEGSELPDHLPAALRLLPRLAPEEEPRALVAEALLPALAKMRAAARGAELPYGRLLDLCEGWLRLAFDAPAGREPARPELHLPVVEGTASPTRFFEGVNERD
ncbi:MAG TPA: hypothetical protein VKZ18_25130 [Polyangia bacterium]|nr:hypothetical protein [Polyangia bacterium]